MEIYEKNAEHYGLLSGWSQHRVRRHYTTIRKKVHKLPLTQNGDVSVDDKLKNRDDILSLFVVVPNSFEKHWNSMTGLFLLSFYRIYSCIILFFLFYMHILICISSIKCHIEKLKCFICFLQVSKNCIFSLYLNEHSSNTIIKQNLYTVSMSQ